MRCKDNEEREAVYSYLVEVAFPSRTSSHLDVVAHATKITPSAASCFKTDSRAKRRCSKLDGLELRSTSTPVQKLLYLTCRDTCYIAEQEYLT